jgi:hypothetical protein
VVKSLGFGVGGPFGATHAFPQNSEKLFLPTSNADLATARAGNAYVAIANRQAEIMMRIASEFGFTPASRSRIATPSQADPVRCVAGGAGRTRKRYLERNKGRAAKSEKCSEGVSFGHMSAIPSRADLTGLRVDVAFVPQAVISTYILCLPKA